MSSLRKVLHKVEDRVIKMLITPEELDAKMVLVENSRKDKEANRISKNEALKKQRQEQEEIRARKKEELRKQQEQREEKEKQEVLAILADVVDINHYSQYEYQQVKKNKELFKSFVQRVLDADEKGLAFIYCEFDKSKKKELRGYLFATNKKVIFIDSRMTYMDKFLYKTIINVNWFADGSVERGLRIQYGKKTLEFDEIFDMEQLKRIGNIILQKSSNR